MVNSSGEFTAGPDTRITDMRQPAPPAERDDLGALLKGVAIGFGASGVAFFAVGGVAFFAVGGNADERPHRFILVLLLLVVAAAAGWAGRRVSNRRAASPRPGRPAQ